MERELVWVEDETSGESTGLGGGDQWREHWFRWRMRPVRRVWVEDETSGECTGLGGGWRHTTDGSHGRSAEL